MPGCQHIVLFHSAYGLRPAVISFADSLRARGHVVYTPDLYNGETFDNRTDAARKFQELGLDGLLDCARAAVQHLPETLVYAGFSNGGACAELLAASRRGARAAVLMHAPLMLRDLGWHEWPARVPVQVHFALKDPIRAEQPIQQLRRKVELSGSSFELHDYDAPGHLFADPGFPAYSASAAEQMKTRVLSFLDSLDRANHTLE